MSPADRIGQDRRGTDTYGQPLMDVPAHKTEFIRPEAVAGPGGFYPDDPTELRQVVTGYLNSAAVVCPEPPVGLIAPHAGYVYSGPVAGWAYRQVQGRTYRAVVVMAPSHREPFSFASVMPEGAYRTPLGPLRIDRELSARLTELAADSAALSLRGHSISPYAEHSLEVQLPFIRVALGEVPLVAVVVGMVNWETCRRLGEGIAKLATEHRLLVVASSDLSHYHTDAAARRLDGRTLEALRAGDARAFYGSCRRGDLEACGAAPIAALLQAATALGNCEVRVLHYATSADVPEGDRGYVVGYVAAAVCRSGGGAGEVPTSGDSTQASESRTADKPLSPETGTELVRLATAALQRALVGKPGLDEPTKRLSDPALDEKHPLFVTLKVRGRLRGCIGQLNPTSELRRAVEETALMAAFDDPRFPPLTSRELRDLTVEVSVLSPMEPVRSPEDIQIGVHGLMIRRGAVQGLLLPQVAPEQKWDRRQFLEGVCRKAGLPSDAWTKPDAQVFRFTAQVFGKSQ